MTGMGKVTAMSTAETRSVTLQPVRWIDGDGRLDGRLRLLDQTALPDRVVHLEPRTVDEVVDAVRRLAVRGAPAIGLVGAYGVAVALAQAAREGWDRPALEAAVARLRAARPTAVALSAGVDAALAAAAAAADSEEEGEEKEENGGGEGRKVDPAAQVAAAVAAGRALAAADEQANHAIGRFGADWILARVDRPRLRVLTHCNTGALATAGWGTALGIIRELHARGRLELVHVDETRPALQGSRLTAWELGQEGIPHVVQVDAAAAGAILGGMIDVAVLGADRIAANGDVANKIGTLGVALACADAGVPFVVAASRATVDPTAASGRHIPIEMRDGEEVLGWAGRRVAPAGSAVYNPAFDITPARLVSVLITEDGPTAPAAP
mgnify:CR=1 FL=1